MKIHHRLRAGLLGITAAATLGGISDLQAQLDFGKSAEFPTSFHGPKPNLELPPQVVAPEGQFTLFADFGKQTPEFCPIYLVNRTSRPVMLLRHGGLKLTRASEDGKWERAQSHYYGARCFSGDFAYSLSPGQHLIVPGYVPPHGTPGRVRYQLFDDLYDNPVSNEGPGLWSARDVEDATRAEAIREQLNAMAESRFDYSGGISTSADIEELENELARLDLDGLVKSREVLAPQIQTLKSLLSKLAPDHPVWKRLAELEERPDKTLSSDAFRKRCLEMIQASPSTAKGFGRPENRPWVVWKALGGLPSNPESLAGWKETFQLAESRLATAGVPEKDAIAKLFYRNAEMAEFISKQTLIAHLDSESLALSRACIAQLAYLEDYEELAIQGNKADLPLKLRILSDFCSAPVGDGARLRTVGREGEQSKFLESCVKAAPWNTFLRFPSGESIHLEPPLSTWFDESFETLLTAAGSGPFPVVNPDGLVGLLEYVEYLSANPGKRTLALLRRTVALREHAPADEPETAKRWRLKVVEKAGYELRLDEFFR